MDEEWHSRLRPFVCSEVLLIAARDRQGKWSAYVKVPLGDRVPSTQHP